MNRDDVIRMAREAGGFVGELPRGDAWLFLEEEYLERFAALVAAAEREACAKVADSLGVHPALNVYNGGPDWYKHGKEIAAAIRARGTL